MQSKNKVKKRLIFAMLFIAAMLFGISGTAQKKVSAASYSVLTIPADKASIKKTISGTTITLKPNPASWNIITAKKGGITKTITKKGSAICITDGKFLYYQENGTKKNTIFQVTLSSGKKKKLVSGTSCDIRDSSGRYLYYINDYSYEERAGKCYALDLQTKKKTYLTKSGDIKVIKGKKILINDSHLDVVNFSFYTANLDGSGLKFIDKGMVYKVTKSKIYYFKAKTDTGYVGEDKIKKYTCTLTGANKKAVSGWTNKTPSTYIYFN